MGILREENGKMRWAGWRSVDDEGNNRIQKNVRKTGEAQEEDLGTIQRSIEEAAKKVAHSTNNKK